MSQYLLLRDNKQSGPYTFEELTSKGLKGYDLIWIEGKSAAWRYPSEIAEFKPFAPVVEEQPYDRFYKRQNSTAQNRQTTVTATTAPAQASAAGYNKSVSNAVTNAVGNPTNENQQPKTVANTTNTQRRIVVILPGGMNQSTGEKVVFHETVENTIAAPAKKNIPEPVGSFDFIPDTRSKAIVGASFASDTVSTPAKEKPNRSSKSNTPKIFAGIVALLTIGVAIGWAFSHDFTKPAAVTPVATAKETIPIPATQTVFNNESSVTVGNENPVTDEQVPNEQLLADQNQMVSDSVLLTGPAETSILKKPTTKTKKPATVVETNQSLPPIIQTVEKESHEIVAATDNDEAEKKVAKKNINDLIKVSRNDFKIGAFGGISNLQLKVSNNSPYTVDLVVVEVKYLLANKKEFKTENIYFKNLAPGATVTREAPKSSRGIEVASKVALITSKALGMYQASL